MCTFHGFSLPFEIAGCCARSTGDRLARLPVAKAGTQRPLRQFRPAACCRRLAKDSASGPEAGPRALERDADREDYALRYWLSEATTGRVGTPWSVGVASPLKPPVACLLFQREDNDVAALQNDFIPRKSRYIRNAGEKYTPKAAGLARSAHPIRRHRAASSSLACGSTLMLTPRRAVRAPAPAHRYRLRFQREAGKVPSSCCQSTADDEKLHRFTASPLHRFTASPLLSGLEQACEHECGHEPGEAAGARTGLGRHGCKWRQLSPLYWVLMAARHARG